MKNKAILVVSFGTSYHETRKKTIEVIEAAVAEEFPDYEIRRAFTSPTIIRKLRQRDGMEIDDVAAAMDRLVREGFDEVTVQPTYVMNGFEYDDLVSTILPYRGQFGCLALGKPLLWSDADYEETASMLKGETSLYDNGDTALVFMGHGTEHPANEAYERLAGYLKQGGTDQYIVGTVESRPGLLEVMEEVGRHQVSRVVLFPLMIVAGDHACNDMAGEDEDSWKSVFMRHGYAVECVLKGLGEYLGIHKIFVRHIREAEYMKI